MEEVYTTAATPAEVQEYVSTLARKKRLPLDVLLLALAALPVIVVERRPRGGAPSHPEEYGCRGAGT